LKQQIEDAEAERLRRLEEEEERRKQAEEDRINNPVQIPKHPMYEAVKGDRIDELMAYYINQLDVQIPFYRMEAKSVDYRAYMFGSKKIQAKLNNDKLLIKVGGGFMVITEFLDQYTQVEFDKLVAKTGG
jgi:hypothetical protein